jgi:hypothetical protein
MSPAPTRGGDALEPADARQERFEYGHGGVPWYLLLLYLAFLAFFTWYVLEYQLPDYLKQGPGRPQAAREDPR